MPEWQNRIIRRDTVDPKTVKAHPQNWRLHPEAQVKALEGLLDEVGWVGEILWNERTGNLIDGHARIELAIEKGEAEVPRIVVDLSEEEERLVLATLDPLSAMAEVDSESLEKLIELIPEQNRATLDMLDGMLPSHLKQEDKQYTRKIEAPIYEPTGEQPETRELCNTLKTTRLIEEINEACLTDEIATFLRLAAYRHTVFDYAKIAEFYSHASPEIQRLFENSALIIIDYNKAIENGLVALSARMVENYQLETKKGSQDEG